MKKITQSWKALLITLVMLCVSVSAMADVYGVLIDGVYYDLRDSWYIDYYDENGNWQNEWFYNVALVTYNPDTEVSNPGSVETYQGDIKIPAKVKYNDTEYPVVAVNSYAFANCRSLTSVELPSSVISIGYGAFRYCTSLTSVSMTGVKQLRGDIFANSALTTISLPKSLKYVESSSFNESGLTSIIVDVNNENFKSIDGVLYDKNVTKIAGFPAKKGGVYKIPSTISSIKSYAFPGNVVLDELIIPANVKKLESNAFSGGSPQIKKLTIEDSKEDITFGRGDAYYFGMTDEFGNYQSGNSTFNTIEELYWGRNIKFSTYSPAFAGSPLKKIEIGEKVTEIQKYTFYRCSSPTTLDIKGGFAQWCLLDFTEQDTDPMRGSTSTQVLFNGSELSGAFTIPDAVTKIPAHGLQYGCSKVTDLTIHAKVTDIADGAFKGLTSLKNVSLASGNTNFALEDNVLYNSNKTKIILFPQLRAGDYTMPSTITEMGEYQFYNCTKLTGITLSNKLKTIPQYAFANCSLLSSISIPASVETIEDHAFDNCIALAKLTIEDSDNTLKLGKGYKEIQHDDWTEYRYLGVWGISPIKELYLGRNVELIDDNKSNYYNDNLSPFNGEYLSVVNIGTKVKKLPAGLFYNCWNIRDVNFNGTIIDWCNITFADESATPFGHSTMGSPILYVKEGPLHSQVNIPKGATKIGAYAFYGQNGVSSVVVPKTVKTIEPYALCGVGDVYIYATDVISLTDANSISGYVYIVDEAVADYRADAVWSLMTDRIYPLGFLQVTVDLIAMTESPALLPALNALEKVNGEYRISALTNLKIRGTMNGWDLMMIRNKMPNLRYLDLSEAEILTNDGGIEYYQGYHTKLKTITPYTFYKLSNLKQVILPEGIEAIEYNAFAESGIKSMVINEGIKTIGYNAFYNCNNLVELTLGKGLESIGSSAFSSCGSLRKLVLPTTLRRIESYAFNGCSSLTDIDFAEGLTDIEYSAFGSCYSLRDVHLPTSLRRIDGSAFRSCNNLNEVHVPSMLESIGDYAFTNCGLKAVYAYTLIPIQINQNTFDYNGVDLFVPGNSFYKYYLNTQWSQFQDVIELNEKDGKPYVYTQWYTARNTDIEIHTDKPINGDEATGYMYPGSGLIIRGNGEQLVKKLILEWNHGSNYPSLIEDGNLNVDELAFIMNVYPHRWYFFCFPCDVKIQDLKFGGKGKYVWRYYDPKKRILGNSGWTNFTGDVLKAGVGYIFQCNVEGNIELPAYNPEYLTQTGDKAVNLISEEAENPQDASWNFVGNPNLSYYSLDDMAADFTSPITVWNDENQTYDAVVPGDDEYEIHPFQAFFVQKPGENENVTFRADNRETFCQSQEKANARRIARSRSAVDEKHLIVNLELSDGKTIDKTRVVFDDSKSMNYEIGSDANKLMSMAEVPQIYTLDNKNVKYALNNRPNLNNEVRLGFLAPADGTYTINVPRMDLRMALKDNVTGTIHDFSNGTYTFLAEKGTNDNRFSLVCSRGTTGISEAGIEGIDIAVVNGGIQINGITDQPVNIYNVKGIRMATLSASGNVNLESGTYIISAGDKTSKIIVK